jgi:hypothetical protein
MNVQDDIEVLETALDAVQTIHSCGEWHEGQAGESNIVSWCGDDVSGVAHVGSAAHRAHITACSPDRIRRVLDALKEAEAMRDAFREVVEGDKQLRAIREKHDL